MELTWKDKLAYQLQEFSEKLPYATDRKKQLHIVEVISGGTLLVFAATGFFFFGHASQITLPPVFPQTFPIAVLPTQPISTQPNALLPLVSLSPTPSVSAQGGIVSSGGISQQLSQKKQSGLTPTPGSFITTTPAKLGGTTGGGSNGGSSHSSGGGNATNTDLSQVVLYFYDDNGNLQKYTPPATPPIDTTWSTYFNTQDNYSVDYPTGWQMIKNYYNGHEGAALYPPGEDTTIHLQDGLQEIGFGMSQFTYQIPYFDSASAIYKTSVTIDGFPGTLYTQGILGSNTIVVIFTYGNTYFGMGGTANDDTMIYVFQHMLGTLRLYGPR